MKHLLMRVVIALVFVAVLIGLLAGSVGQLPMAAQHYMDMGLNMTFAKVFGPSPARDLRELQWIILNDPNRQDYADGYTDGQAANLAPLIEDMQKEATRGEGSLAKLMTPNPAYENEVTRQKLTAYWSGYAQALSIRLGLRVDVGRPTHGCWDGICVLVFNWRPEDLKNYLFIVTQ